MQGGWDLEGEYYPPEEALEWKAKQVLDAHKFTVDHEDPRPYSEIAKYLGYEAELGE